MAKGNYLEDMEMCVLDALIDVNETVQDCYPSESIIQTTLMMSYQQLSPEQQVQILEQVGADWFVKMATKIERRLRGLTN